MNILPLLAFYFVNSQAQFSDRDINNEIAQSLLYVIDEFFVQRSSSCVLILSCERQHTMYFYKDLMEQLFHNWSNIKTQILINNEVPGVVRQGERVHNLLLIDSADSFLKIDPAYKVQNYDINEYYHIFLQNFDRFHDNDIQRILDYCWKHYIINVNVQVQKASGELIVYTYFPYSETHCGKVIPVEINRYHNGTMMNKVLFPEKLKNMHNCPLRVVAWNAPPYIALDLTKKGRNALSGIEGTLLKELSILMNFNIVYLTPPNNEDRGQIFGNHSTGAIRMLRKRQADLSLGCFWFVENRIRMLTASDPYLQATNGAIFLANPSNFAPVKALWFQFKLDASISLLTSFVIASVLLHGLSWLLDKRPPYQLAVKQKNIFVRFIASTLGMSSTLRPRENCGRIFFISWMFFVLVIRTVFGAAIYHIIRNNLFRRAPTSIRDIMRLNYTFALNEIAFTSLRVTSVFRDTGLGHIIIGGYPPSVFDYIEEHPNERLLTVAPLGFLLHYISINRKAGVLTILKETFFLQSTCIYFSKHSFLVDRVNYLVRRINAVGLMDGWTKMAIDLSYLGAKKPHLETTVGQSELTGIYVLCGGLLALSIVVFCLEIISVKLKCLRTFFERI